MPMSPRLMKLVSGAAAPTPVLELSGPSSGNCLEASANFTVTITNPPAGDTVITFVSTDGGDVFTPTTRTLNSGNLSATFTVTPDATSGARTISITNDRSISNPAGVSYTAAATLASIFSGQIWGWWKADAGTFQTSGGSAATADTDPVGELRDQSGNSRHLVQATSGFRPQLRTNVVGSLPVIRGDVSDDFLSLAAVPTDTAGAVILVFRMATSPTNGQTILNCSDQASTTRFLRWHYASSGTIWQQEQRNNDTLDRIPSSSTVSANNTYLMEHVSSGTAYTMRIDDINQTITPSSGTDSGDWFGDTANMDSITLLAHYTTAFAMPWKGDFCEALIISGAVTAQQMSDARAILNSKWSAF
jgi:hypothetical protein